MGKSNATCRSLISSSSSLFLLSLLLLVEDEEVDISRNDIPNSLSRIATFFASRINFAHRSNALDGTHPALRQSPPDNSALIMQLLAPRRAAYLNIHYTREKMCVCVCVRCNQIDDKEKDMCCN